MPQLFNHCKECCEYVNVLVLEVAVILTEEGHVLGV